MKNRKSLSRFALFSLVGLSAGTPITCGDPSKHVGRGTIIQSVLLSHLDPEQITAKLSSAGFDTSAVRLGVDLHRLEYRTLSAAGQPTWASGLLALPSDGAAASIAVSFTHGTELARLDAPSTSVDSDDAWEISPALTYASAGFVVSAPDYLGMGTGPGFHPYMDTPSETSAALDMLRASRAFALQQGRRLARDVAATGFSQGALPALGLARELSETGDPSFRICAAAPISGPYRLSQWVREAIEGTSSVNPKAATVYLAYLAVEWNRIHQLYTQPSEWYRAPYASGIDAIMDGNHAPMEVVTFLPDTPAELFTDEALQTLASPSGRLASIFEVSDRNCDFGTTVPLRLFAATGDTDVSIAYSVECQAQLTSLGSTVQLINVGDFDHLGSNIQATGQLAAWFAQLRDEHICTIED